MTSKPCAALLIGGFLLSLGLGVAQAGVPACVSLATLGSPVSENFDTLAQTGTTNALAITGWSLTETGGGARDNELYAADTGASNTGDTYSYGAAAASDRALGGLQSGTLIPVFGACFVNNTGATVTSLDVAYRGEQWRLGTAGRADQIDFQFSTDATSLVTGTWTDENSLDFATPNQVTVGAKDGNVAPNFTAISSSLPGLTLAAGNVIWIRWNDLNASGADDGLTVDDFSITPQGAGAPSADLVLTKSDSADPVNAGAALDYMISITNNGPDPAATVTITDTVPAGVSITGFSSFPGWTCMAPGATYTCTIASMPVGTANFTLNTLVDAAVAAGTVLSNTASATSGTADPMPGNESDTETTTVSTSADLAVSVADAPDAVNPGSALTYTISFSNAGPSESVGVTLSDTLPAGTSFASLVVPAGWSCMTPAVGATGTVNCSALANVGVGVTGDAVFTLVVNVDAAAVPGSIISNTAAISSMTSDPSNANDSATATTTVGAGSADLSVSKTATPEPVTAGANLSYTITAANAGPSNATMAALNDTLPAGTSFVSLASPGGWSCTTPAVGAAGTVDCGNPSMAIGSAVFTLVVNVDATVSGGTVIANTATVSSTSTDPNPGNESATANSTVSAPAAITGTKSASGNLVPGGSVTYTIVLSNSAMTSQGDNPGDEFVDVLPAGLTLVSATASSGTAVASIGTNAVTWNGSIAGGGSVTITIDASIDANVSNGSTITNQGTINFDADGNGTNESTTSTDNPATGTALDGTSILVLGIATAVPSASDWSRLLLMLALALTAGLAMRRRIA